MCANWPAPQIENFRYMLRSGMLGWFSLMLDTSQWSPQQRAEARAQIALYKSALRPLIREADLYHVTERPDGVNWDGIEYYSGKLRRGVLYAFRGTAPDRTHSPIPLARPQAPAAATGSRSRIRARPRIRCSTGHSLMQEGVEVALPLPVSSELIFIEEVP